MLTRLLNSLTRRIIRARLRSAIKHRLYLDNLIAQRVLDAKSLHPENLSRALIAREIEYLLLPQRESTIQLIDELSTRLAKI